MADDLAAWLSDPYSPVARDRVRSIPAFAVRTLLLPNLPTIETVADLDHLIEVLLDTALDHVEIGAVIEDDEFGAAAGDNDALWMLIEAGMLRIAEARTAEFAEKRLHIRWVLRDMGSSGQASPALWASKGLEPILVHTEPLCTGLGCRSEQDLLWEAATTLVGDAQFRASRRVGGPRCQ
jgi:hypothetical protein